MVRRVISVTVAAAMAVAVATSAGVAAADTPAPPAPQNHASTSGRAAVDHAPPPLPPVGPYRSVASKSPAPPSNLAAPMGLSAPVSALVADSASGKLPPGQVVRAAAALLSPGIPVPAKYRASRLNDLDVLALIATIGSAGPKLSGKDQANVGPGRLDSDRADSRERVGGPDVRCADTHQPVQLSARWRARAHQVGQLRQVRFER